jgi:30S ribosomal protein S31
MGKGDRRSRRGKLFRGTFGRTRKHAAPSAGVSAPAAAKSNEATAEVKPEAPKKKRVAKKKAE